MENNLDDVLIDTLEGKSQKKSNKRIILIIVASVVLLGVLGVSALMLTKQDLKPESQNSEFDEQLEKISILEEPKIENESNNKIADKEVEQDDVKINKLIADIKTRQSQETVKPNIIQAQNKKKTQVEEQEAVNLDKSLQTEKTHAQKNIKESNQTEKNRKIANKSEEKVIPSDPKPKKKEEVIPITKNPIGEKKIQTSQTKKLKTTIPSDKSASQLFQSVKKSVPKGYYLQVGVFGGTPQTNFINKLKAYPYITDKIQYGGKVLTRYLIGPFPIKEMAEQKIEEVAHNITKPVIIEIR